MSRTPSADAAAATGDGAPAGGPRTITLQYPVSPRPRYGEAWGLPRHPELFDIVAAGTAHHARVLASITRHVDALRRIPRESADEREPRWVNGWLPGLDTAALYAFTVERAPATYLEVGSGNSTRAVRRAVDDSRLATRIVSIDPEPRALCDELCDEVVRRPLEDTDLVVFERLRAGDMCFIDNSHCAYQNSDVTVSFLEVLPRIAPGVLVGIHDIFLPDDYPEAWVDRWYNEQYLLSAYLLGGGAGASIEFPSWHVTHDPAHSVAMNELWDHPEFEGVERHGNAFWMVTAQ